MSESRDKYRRDRDAEIVRLTKLGIPTTRIMRLLRVSSTVIYNARKAANVQTPKRPPLTADQKYRAKRMLLDGASRKEVARTLDCGESQLRNEFPELCWTAEDKRIAENELVPHKLIDGFARPIRRRSSPSVKTHAELKEGNRQT